MKTKPYLLVFTLLFISCFWSLIYGQKIIKSIHKLITHEQVYKDMMFLASDDLMGRKTGQPGNQVAAMYIAEQLRQAGVKPVPGQTDFFQTIPFVKYIPARDGKLRINDVTFDISSNMVILDGGPANNLQNDAVFADYGWIDTLTGRDDYQGLDVNGKFVIVQGGLPQGGTPLEVFASMVKKRAFAKSRGAIGLVELYGLSFSWNFFKNYFSKERLEIVSEVVTPSSLFYSWINTSGEGLIFKRGGLYQVELSTSGGQTKNVDAVNVLGVIPGKNKDLKNQYVMLTAHFDHVGVNAGAHTGNDSIWNGARDNAWGVVSLLAASRVLVKNPADRSILIALVNGEEMGLLGSKYLSDHPVIPWNKVIFDFNTDGAGYSDTSIASIIGLNRVGAADEINAGCVAFGLKTFADPAPEQGLFDRSDNVNFAKLGIPAPTIGAGFTSFNAEIAKYYHQAIDNPESLNYRYLLRFSKAFTLATINIANKKSAPHWIAGDKYEAAGKRLYGY
ncbi:MAG: M28 family peptidase [Saprospiraceae bacterium]